jgi:hypothetical protein
LSTHSGVWTVLPLFRTKTPLSRRNPDQMSVFPGTARPLRAPLSLLRRPGTLGWRAILLGRSAVGNHWLPRCNPPGSPRRNSPHACYAFPVRVAGLGIAPSRVRLPSQSPSQTFVAARFQRAPLRRLFWDWARFRRAHLRHVENVPPPLMQGSMSGCEHCHWRTGDMSRRVSGHVPGDSRRRVARCYLPLSRTIQGACLCATHHAVVRLVPGDQATPSAMLRVGYPRRVAALRPQRGSAKAGQRQKCQIIELSEYLRNR